MSAQTIAAAVAAPGAHDAAPAAPLARPRAAAAPPAVMIEVQDLSKHFTLHLQGGVRIPVLAGVHLRVQAGECVALAGPSGAGKSTLLRALYGTYRAGGGAIRLRHRGALLDLAQASPREVVQARAESIGTVTQFLRVVPRVSALEVVAQAVRGATPEAARARAAALLDRLHIPARLHALPPATFSGGEQQRVNLARGFAGRFPVLLLDEPTASLDAANRDVVIAMIAEAKRKGVAILGIFHDTAVRDAVADRLHHVAPLEDAPAEASAPAAPPAFPRDAA